jgi:hypothetical protein
MATPARMAAANFFMISSLRPVRRDPDWPEGRHRGFFSSLKKIVIQQYDAVNCDSDGF